MSLPIELVELYRQWKRWSEQEGEAIEVAAWAEVDKCQAAKHLLKSRIVMLTEGLDARLGSADWKETERELRRVISDLIGMEMRNNERLADKRKKAEAESAQLEQASRNLRQVQMAYSPATRPNWNSYS